MDNKTSIYVYNNITDFLNQMDYLTDEYNTIMHYHMYIKDIMAVRNQLKYIQKKELLCSYGFLTQKIFKITISDNKKKYCITYKFKHRYNYDIFKREIRKIELCQYTP